MLYMEVLQGFKKCTLINKKQTRVFYKTRKYKLYVWVKKLITFLRNINKQLAHLDFRVLIVLEKIN